MSSVFDPKNPRGPRPLILARIEATDGDVCYLSTAAACGFSYLPYGSQNWQARLLDENIGAIQAMSVLGLDIPPSVTLKIDDGDASIWLNHYNPHGWGGAKVTLVYIEWDVAADSYSTDAITWSFLGGAVTYQNGVLTLAAGSRSSFQSIKVPAVPIQRRCPRNFPQTVADRAAGVTDKLRLIGQCVYSPDQIGGVGNYESGTTPFTDCPKDRAGCMLRLGDPSATGVAPDGDIAHDTSGRPTGHFGGITWRAPDKYGGTKYTTGQAIFGFNQPNDAIYGGYWPEVLGAQWVRAKIVNTAADPNTLRGEAVACFAPWGPVYGLDGGALTILINGELVNYLNDADKNFSWGWNNSGGPIGALNRGPIIDGKGDPYGSYAGLWWVVPSELASGGSSPTIDVQIGAQTLPYLTGSGSSPTVNFGTTHNPVWHLFYMILRAGYTLAEIGAQSFMDAADFCAASISYTDQNGNAATHARYRSGFVLEDSSRQTIGQAVAALRNNCGLMLAPNSASGLLEVYPERTLAGQQPAPVPGSNSSAPIASQLEDGTAANGYPAYVFTEADYEQSSFKIYTLDTQDTPNRFALTFQDEDNQLQSDSLALVDPDGYAAAGNQEIDSQGNILGIPNFDQAIRRANTLLARARRGNSRDDAKGTEFIQFVTTHKAVHLASRPGYICLIRHQKLQLADIQIRIISAQPTKDFERCTVLARRHNDDWHLDAYGQNPQPFYSNPFASPRQGPPWPWRPGLQPNSGTDVLFPFPAASAVVYRSGSDICLVGMRPINSVSSLCGAPQVPPQATVSTGGSIPAGDLVLQLVAIDANGDVSSPSTYIRATVGSGSSTVTIPNIVWSAGTAGYRVYAGRDSQRMWSVDTASATPSSITLTDLSLLYSLGNYDVGRPDINAVSLRVQVTRIIDAGILVSPITAVSLHTLTIPATPATDDWKDRVISRLGSSTIVDSGGVGSSLVDGLSLGGGLHMKASGNSTAGVVTVPDSLTGFGGKGVAVGDVFTVRAYANIAGDTTIGDALFVNSLTPGGLPADSRKGAIVWIYAGRGAGQRRRVVSNDATTLTIDSAWDTNPDSTSCFMTLESAPVASVDLDPVVTSANAAAGAEDIGILSRLTVPDTESGAYLARVMTTDRNGNTAIADYSPWQEVYLVPNEVAQRVVSTTPYTIDPLTDETVTFVPGASVVNLPPGSSSRRRPITLINKSGGALTLTVNAASGDTSDVSSIPSGLSFTIQKS